MNIQENVPLAPLTTFQIGGPARYLVLAQNISEVCRTLEFAKEKSLPVFILGGGSNLLVSDDGYYGVVLKIETKGVVIEEGTKEASKVLIAESGESWDALVERTTTEGWWGMENLSGIPGTVGGAVVQNVGAYGQAVSEVLLWTEALDIETGDIKRFTNEECTFGYRESFFKHHTNYVVLRAAFALSTIAAPNTSYKDLAKLFADTTADLRAIREAVLSIRKDKFPDLALEGTAGSFFKNPIVTEEQAMLLEEDYPGLPVFVLPETKGVKVPLAWFLDSTHGVIDAENIKRGGARLFEKQPLVIAAKRNTSAKEVQALAQEVQKQIKEKIHIDIEPEVKII